MSIIFDALKKAADKKGGKENKPGEPPKETVPVNPAEVHAMHKKRDKAEFIFLILLVGILLFLSSDLIFKKGRRAVKKPAAPSAKAVIPLLGISEQFPLSDLSKGSIDDSAKAAVPDLVLDGIIYDTKDPVAIINGKILKVGERIQDLEVKSIESESAELINLKDNTTITVKLQ